MKRKSLMACLALIAGMFLITGEAEAYSSSSHTGCKSVDGKSIGTCGGKDDSDPTNPAPAPAPTPTHTHYHHHFHPHHHSHFHFHHRHH